MIIACDVDGVVADLYPAWLRRYNADYNDTLTVEGLTSWHIQNHVKPECGTKIFDYLRQPDLYEEVQPIEHAEVGIRTLRKIGHRVVFVSSCGRGTTDQKWEWLERHAFLPKGRYYHDDLIICHDKKIINADILIDDGEHNIASWGDRGLLFGNYPHNQHATGSFLRVADWRAVVQEIM